MKKLFALMIIIIVFLISSGFTNEDTYQVIVRHIFNETEIVTVNEYAPAGTQYSVEPLRDKIIDGYEDYHWELAYASIDGGSSQIGETYDVIFLPTRATTFTLIHDDTTVEYNYVAYKNLHVSYQWEKCAKWCWIT